MNLFRKLLRTESLQWNFVGNVAGRLCNGVLSIVSVPVFVHLLGAEAFGIVSFVTTFQAMLALLDLGLSGTVRREVATLRAPGDEAAAADTVRTFEYVYWGVAVAIGGGFALVAGWLSHSWVTVQTLSTADVRLAILLGGLAFAIRWPVALYTGVLQGRERQVLQNAIMVAAALARVGTALAALLLVARTVECFLVAQTVVNVVEVVLFRQAARGVLGRDSRGGFSLAVVRRVWRYAVGVNLVGTFGMLVSGADKLLISKLLPLAQLTYYSMASTATGALQFIYLALQVSLFPRLASAWHRKDLAEVRRNYLMGMRVSVVLCAPLAFVLLFFPDEILLLWTRSPGLVNEVSPVLPVLALATLLNCAQGVPLNALLAIGETRLPLLVNLVSLPLMVAGGYLAVTSHGAVGAAWCWVAANLVCLVAYGWRCSRVFVIDASGRYTGGFPVLSVGGQLALFVLAKAIVPQWGGLVGAVVTTVAAYGPGLWLLDAESRSKLLGPISRFLPIGAKS